MVGTKSLPVYGFFHFTKLATFMRFERTHKQEAIWDQPWWVPKLLPVYWFLLFTRLAIIIRIERRNTRSDLGLQIWFPSMSSDELITEAGSICYKCQEKRRTYFWKTRSFGYVFVGPPGRFCVFRGSVLEASWSLLQVCGTQRQVFWYSRLAASRRVWEGHFFGVKMSQPRDWRVGQFHWWIQPN